MSVVSQPLVNIQLLQAQVVDAFRDRRNAIVSQNGATGTATDKELVQDVHLMSDTDMRTNFGVGFLYQQIIAWRETVNVSGGGVVPVLDVIPVDPSGTGVAATATLQFTGSATADGTYIIDVVSEELYRMTVSIDSGTAENDIAIAVEAAVSTLTDALFTSGVATNTVTYTAVDVGTIGDYYGIRISGEVPGTTPTVVGWTGGANDPVLTDALDSITELRVTGLAWPEAWQASISIPTDEFDTRFNSSNQLLDGVIFTGHDDTLADFKSFISPLNSQSLVVGGNNRIDDTLDKGPAILHPADFSMCEFMAVRAKRLSTGAQIADLVIANGLADSTGGPSLASLAYHNTLLGRTPVTLPKNLYSGTEMIELRDLGGMAFGVNIAGNSMITNSVVTTRTTDAAGNSNDSFLYLNFVDTGSVCREIFFSTLKAAFPQSRLTDGDLVANRSIENEASIKAILLQIYGTLAELVLVQAGNDATSYFRDNTTVEVTLSQRLVTINGPLPIVTQIGQIDYNLALTFSLTGERLEITV